MQGIKLVIKGHMQGQFQIEGYIKVNSNVKNVKILFKKNTNS